MHVRKVFAPTLQWLSILCQHFPSVLIACVTLALPLHLGCCWMLC